MPSVVNSAPSCQASAQMWPGQSIQAREGCPASFSRLRFHPFWVTKAGCPGGEEQTATQRYCPLRLAYCADASLVAIVAANIPAIMANPVTSFMTSLHLLSRLSRAYRPVRIPQPPRRQPIQNEEMQAVTDGNLNQRKSTHLDR